MSGANATESFKPLTAQQRVRFSWLDEPHLKKVIAALEAAEAGAARYVGGCVRDSLLGCAPKDFDVATTLTPDAATTALKAAGRAREEGGHERAAATSATSACLRLTEVDADAL